MNPSWTDVVIAICSILTVGITGGAVIYAALQWVESRQSRRDAADAETARNQPSVLVYLEPNEWDGANTMLVIQNFGPTAATNVVVTLDEPIRRDTSDPHFQSVELPEFAVFPPGYEWRTWFDRTAGRPETGLPMRYTGEVRFQGLKGAWHRQPVVLDVDPMRARVYSMPKSFGDVVKALEALTKQIAKNNKG